MKQIITTAYQNLFVCSLSDQDYLLNLLIAFLLFDSFKICSFIQS